MSASRAVVRVRVAVMFMFMVVPALVLSRNFPSILITMYIITIRLSALL